MEDERFPIIDISKLVESQGKDEAILNEAAKELMDGFSKWGFIYLRGHPIAKESIEKMFRDSEGFFKQPIEKKNEVLIDGADIDYVMGYVPFKKQTFDYSKPFDLKEAFDYMHHMKPEMKSKLSPAFFELFKDFFTQCHDLTLLLFRLLATSLGLEDLEFFHKAHDKLGRLGNTSIMRSLYYPAKEKSEILEEQSRCSEHTDYGTITLLFPKSKGLEVKSPSGHFIKAKVIPGTIVVNAADLLERWSSGRIKSTPHRVTIQTSDMSKPRQSMAFFVSPDNDCLVECLDGSNKYEPVNSFKYLDGRFKYNMIKS
ncbi:uncharacterized protein [Clytia hemisphaerica]